jgi:hypothetical protein
VGLEVWVRGARPFGLEGSVVFDFLTGAVFTRIAAASPRPRKNYPFSVSLEDEPRDYVGGIIGTGGSSCSVIICGSAVEARISGVLKGETNVLDWPPRDVRYIASASWVAVEVATHGARRRKESVVRRSRDVEESGRA